MAIILGARFQPNFTEHVQLEMEGKLVKRTLFEGNQHLYKKKET